jgi:hypothetical protein
LPACSFIESAGQTCIQVPQGKAQRGTYQMRKYRIQCLQRKPRNGKACKILPGRILISASNISATGRDVCTGVKRYTKTRRERI